AVFQAVSARHHIEGCGNLFDNGAADDRLSRGESIQQSVVAKVIDVARNPFGATKDIVDRPGRKDIRTRRAGDLQTRVNVLSCFFDVGERGDFATQRDALLELAQVRIVQDVAQLLLARENDLQLLRRVRFEIAEQPR